MKQMRTKQNVAKRSLISTMAILSLAVPFTAASLSGCDTLARISFRDNTFTGFNIVGLSGPRGDSCIGSTDGKAVMRLVLNSTEGAVHSEMVVGTDKVAFTRDSIELERQAIFSMPNEQCSNMCEQSSMSCGFGDTGLSSDDANKRCHARDLGLGIVGDPKFISSVDKNQIFGVMIENTGSLDGTLPKSIIDLFPDYKNSMTGEGTPDGLGDSPIDIQSFNSLRATDNSNRRKSALGTMVNRWRNVSQFASDNFQKKTFFGLWSFENSPGTLRSAVDGAQWTTSPSAAKDAVENLPSDTTNTQASVFESINTLLTSEDGYASTNFDGAEKVLVVFVDGPDELRLKRQDAASVISNAKGTGDVRIFIVHLDSETKLVGADGKTPTYVDDPKYIEEQDGFASEGDCDCKNFEVCRKVTKYSDVPNTEADFLPAGDKQDKFFCVPKRDENGRIGPIDDYANIACATGGGYIYVPEARTLRQNIEWLPAVLDGLWEVPVNADAFSRGSVKGEQFYSFQADVGITLDNVRENFAASQQGQYDQKDNRFVLYGQFKDN